MNYKDISGLVDYETREDVIDYAASIAQDGMVFVELGCYLGSTLCRLAHKIKERGIKAQVYGIDNWVCDNISQESINWSNLESRDQVFEEFKKNVEACDLKDIIKYIKSDTTIASMLFADNSVDYIFFDASHGYGGLKDELEAWKLKLKANSLAACHDWPSPDIQRACREVFGECEVVRGGSAAWLRKTL